MPGPASSLVIACGALARELAEIQRVNNLGALDIECLPAILHNRPERIPGEVRARIRRARGTYDNILVGYADCGTGGLLDAVCEEEGVTRLPGAHCYEFFAGHGAFEALQEAELGTFYLTDYLAKHFDRLIWQGLGMADHPELRDLYFGNYRRVVLLQQQPNPHLIAHAEAAARQLDLPLEVIDTGLDGLAETVVGFAASRVGQ